MKFTEFSVGKHSDLQNKSPRQIETSQFESIPSNTCCADRCFRTYKLFNLLAELINLVAINSSQSSSTSFFISSPPLSESLNVCIYLSRGSFYSSCQVKGNSKDSLGVFNSSRKTVNHIYRSLFCSGESDKFDACAHVHLLAYTCATIYTKFCCCVVKIEV
ncbi:unnamed protein product [Rangifer tarandus platyrhynchus]|uniref:Uncharacterized protein n=1 Tax=Rangifer tarandus platyrhynchus TaxID=3082113 RepID=A0ABN9A381_RANTA|nr:unnamed protein product [Rangifer tarandus platyrhynchus]